MSRVSTVQITRADAKTNSAGQVFQPLLLWVIPSLQPKSRSGDYKIYRERHKTKQAEIQ